jgi:photosystem II S4 domain protein
MLPRQDLLKGTEFRETMARAIDLAEKALKNWEPICSSFLSPPEVAEVTTRFQSLAELHLLAWGGYPQAERQRLVLARTSLPLTPEEVPIAALSIRGNFLFDPASHPDFLGAILGTGIVRDTVGDIIVLGEQGAQVLVEPEILDHLQLHLQQVRSVPVTVTPISLDQLRIPPPRTKSITTFEASLRLDALGSAGFGLSRSKMADEISKGEVRVNWKTVTQPSYALSVADLIAVRGRGRLQVDEIAETKKGRYKVAMTRFM